MFNPWFLIIGAIGFIMVIIGIQGTQHTVLSAFKGVKKGQTSLQSTALSKALNS